MYRLRDYHSNTKHEWGGAHGCVIDDDLPNHYTFINHSCMHAHVCARIFITPFSLSISLSLSLSLPLLSAFSDFFSADTLAGSMETPESGSGGN